MDGGYMIGNLGGVLLAFAGLGTMKMTLALPVLVLVGLGV